MVFDSPFLCELFFAFIDKYIKNEKILYVTVLLLVFFGSEATNVFDFRLPWGIDAALVGLGFYMLGFLMQSKKEILLIKKVSNLKIVTLMIGVLVCSALIMINGYINMREGKYAILPLTFFNAMFAIVIGVNIAKQIIKLMRFKCFNYFGEWLKGIGRNSIVYLCLNQLIIMICLGLVRTMNCSFYVGKIVELFLALLLLYFCEKIYATIKFIRKIIQRERVNESYL